jgi:HAD superfamily hydrolase (TIGR01509 family)
MTSIRTESRRPLEAVIFDMDGLMLDTEPLYKQAWTEEAASLGFPLEDSLYGRFRGRTGPDSEAILRQAFGPAFPMEEFRRQRRRRWDELVQQQGIDLKPGLIGLLDQLDGNKVPRAVATSSARRQAEISLLAAGLSGRFPVVVTGDQVARGKPAPDLFLEAARRLAVQADRCLVLEDSAAGVRAAAAAGMPAILIPDGTSPEPEERRRAYRVLPDLVRAAPVVMELLQGGARSLPESADRGGGDNATS